MCQPQISKYYRRRADELRLAARAHRSPGNRDTLLYFADDFEGLAAEAEVVEQAQRRKPVAQRH